MKKINLIEMLQGCSKRNGTTFRQSNPDGQTTVKRQSRLMSHRGYLKNLAMIFAVLMLSIANIGMAWGTSGIITAASTTDLGKGNTPRYVVEQAGVGRLMKNATGSSSWSVSDGKLTTGSSKFALQTYNAISSIVINGYGTGSGRTFSSMRVGTTTENYTAAAATGTGTMSSTESSQTITITPSSTIAANSYIEITLSGNIYIYSVELVYAGSSGKNIYLKPNGIWNPGSGERFAAYYWKSANTSDNGWVDFASYNACTPCFKATIPSGYDKVILCRMDGSKAANNWDNRWNQTLDQTVPTGNDTCFTISSINGCTDGKSCGSWGTYTAPTYTISFNGNGSTSGSTSSHTGIACNGSQTLRANGFSRTGWTFTGWNTSAYGDGDAYAAGATISSITSDITLYAQWEKVMYMKSSMSWWYDASAWFAVWVANADESKQAWVAMTKAENCSDPEVYKATVPGNGYTKVVFVRKNPANMTLATWDNKWNQSSKESMPTSNNQFTITGGSDDNCTGSWGTYSAPTLTISYNNGGGSGSMSSQTSIACGTDKATTANAFTRDGYSFTGWKADVDVKVGGSTKTAGTLLADGVTIQDISSNITLTAQWEEVVTLYTVTYNVNGGGSVTPTSATQASSGASVTLPTPTWSGYTFDGWYSAGAKIGNGGASYTPTADITLYAHWTDNISGKVFSFIDNNYGDKFKSFTSYGWVAKDSTGRNKTFTNASTGVEYRVSAAGWDKKNNAISALAKFFGGTSSMSIVIPTGKIATVKVSYGAYGNGDDYKLTINSADQAAVSSKLDNEHTNAQVISDMKEITLNSQTGTLTLGIHSSSKNLYIGRVSAVITGYTVSYAAGTYGSGSLASGTKTAGSSFTLSNSSSAFTRSGYVYDGWSINEDGRTKDYNLGDSYTTDAVITLYPHWVADCVAPTEVNISGTYHYFPGETISLTAAAEGGSGTPTTYQWYKGGTADGNIIEDATSATYTKENCTFADAGSYYCKVTRGGSCSTFSGNYDVKILHLYVNTGRNGTPYKDVDFVKIDAFTARATISLGANWDYGFNIADGCGHYYGNSGKMTEDNCTDWSMDVDGTDCLMRTTNGATYTFTVDYTTLTAPVVSITYPSANQAVDKVIYFDNSARNWSTLHYRIGRTNHTQATAMTQVPGTANLYKVTTAAYNNFSGWHIANNAGWTGDNNSIYRTNTNDDQYSITYATAHEGGAVTDAAITVTPTTSRGMGGDKDLNDNCEFYNYEITTGMKTQNVSITAPSNGTITVNYVDVSGAAQAFSSGNRDLAHTCNITVTAEPAAGYAEPATVSINGASHNNRDPYTITGTTVVAATFSPASYTVTLNTNSGTINAGNVTSYTYGTGATLPTNVTKDGFTFDGWYDNSGLTGSAVTTISTTATGNKEYWAKWTEDAGSSKCITFNSTSAPSVSGVTIKKVAGGDGGSTYTANGFVMSKSNDYITFDISALGNLTKATFTAKTGSASKTIGYGYTDGTTYVGEVPSSGTSDTEFHEYEITSIPDNTTRFTLVRRGTKTTITEVCLFYTPDVCSDPVINEGSTKSSFAGGTWAQNSGHTITITATGADSYEWYRNTSATDAGATKLSETSNTLDITDVTPGTYYFKAVAKSGACSSSTEWGWCGAMTITASGHTVTYNYNGATGGASPASATGTSVTLPTPTRTGYVLDGWYTTAGAKVDDGGATYEPEADITLYARWQKACDAGAGSVATFNFNAGNSTGLTIETNGANATYSVVNSKTNNIPVLDSYFLASSFKNDASGIITITTDATYTDIDSIKLNSAATDNANPTIAIFTVLGETETKQQSAFALSSGSVKTWRATPYKKDLSSKKPDGKVRFKLTTGGSGKSAGLDNIQIFYGGGFGTCYHVYYHGNGAESGFVSDTTSYADDAKATVLGYNDSRYPLTKDDYDFQGWAITAGGSVAYSAGEKITIDGADVHLYAKWAPTSSALVTWKMETANDEAWSTTTGTGTTDETNITSISTAHDEGDNKAKNSATAKTAMATAEVSSTAAPDKSARFTFTIGATMQVEISKFDCKVFNVNSGNRTYKAQISDEAGNVYNSTNTVAVSTEATLTDASFVFGSGKILRGAVTIRVYAWGSGSEFRMGPDVKFYGTVENYECATPAAPTISGVSEYVPGQTITLTASHDGENYDNLTTYTWYEGDAWGSTSEVQAAATGESGYTLTIASCTTGNAGHYWCEVANGTCNAHNSVEYSVIVYPTYNITYNLNGGTNPVDPAPKTSYTRFDEDYTLPTPTRDGFVFAGWYEASDFSGLPTVVLGAGSVGDKEYYAKWGAVVTVSWTVTKVDDDLYRGGGGYSVKAVINETDWSAGFMDELELTATEGVTLKNIVASENDESKVQVTADFDITTDLAADATEISFTLNVPADEKYGPKVDKHSETLTSCAGGSSTISIFKGTADGDNTNTKDAVKYKQDGKWTDGDTDFASTAKNVKDDLMDISGWTSSNRVVNGVTYVRGIENGGNDASKNYFQFDVPEGYTATFYIVYGKSGGSANFGLRTTKSTPAADANSKWYASASSGSKLYGATISDIPEGTYYLVSSSGKSVFAEINVIVAPTGGGGGGSKITPTLSWDPALYTDGDWDSENNRLDKETGDPDFTFVANQNKNSLGAITYSSSDETVATVNATTGKVHIAGAAGTATITATLAASGCFNGATATYTINVVDNCSDVPGTISTEDLGCAGIQMTVSGHTTSGETVSYQWYKDGVSLAPDAQEATYTTSAAGEYYVVVTNTGTDHCAMASTNTIKVAAKAAISVPTNIVDSWYVKNGRRTPDIALWKTTGVSTFTVKNNAGGATIENIGGCTFYLGDDGIIYLKGTTSTGAAPSDMETGDLVIKVEVKDECGSNTKTSSNITIHRQAATNYKEIAFVADGGKGMKKDSITVGHGDGTELYEYLDSVGTAAKKRLFKLSERNIYWTTDEKAIREEYSQFDAILITDDPSTNTVVKKGDDYKTKGYVNAFGTMVDVRPIFTMEAYVSALKNWGSKGIKGSPESPNPRQYEMRLECKDHEIYGAGLPTPEDGTNVWEEVIDGETFRHVIIVDSTKGVYKGVAYNAETAGNEKPALQGFTGEAAGSLLGLGRILEGTLQAAIERQEEPAARLLVMGINAKALHETCALTNEGKAVIKNILTYLLKTNMEEVDDCSNYFTGKVSSDWNNTANWSKSALPSSEAKVRILAPCVISGIQPHVLQVTIVNNGNSNIRNTATGSAVCDGTLTIQPDGALIADGKIRSAVAPYFAANNLMPTTPEMLTINTRSDAQAALIFDNEEGLTKATVNLYSLGRVVSSTYQFQYMAVPMEVVPVNPSFANETHDGTMILTYVWNENGGWERRGYYEDLRAFECVGITTNSTSAMDYKMKGNLASTSQKEIALTNGSGAEYANNIIGNSWTAPIDIASLKTAIGNDNNVQKTIYIYVTGNDGDEGAHSGTSGSAGQWLAVPIDASGWSGWSGLKVIPAMQAFLIRVSAETSLELNYNDVVRKTATENLNEPLRAPRRAAADKDITMTTIHVADSKTYADLRLFEGKRFDEEFDNGWEAEYLPCDGRTATLYAETEAGQMAVAALPELEGTVLGFAPGKETEYTFTFLGGNGEYYLNDLKLKNSTLMSAENSYVFTFEEGDTNRFYISRTAINAPEVATGMENLDAAAPKVQKIIYNDKLYIIRGGKVYSADGQVVK